ncbi:hypothetical protein [Vampirovibrio sp.]|uniref:hypothetical protein n=1 Tax=Vampirovibrio sp. TaxID=2717857 RepID=UPI003593E9D0
MLNAQNFNPFSSLSAKAGSASGGAKGASAGSSKAAGSGDDLATFQSALKQGAIAPNLNQPLPATGQGQRLFAMG